MADQTEALHSFLEAAAQKGAFSGSVLLAQQGEKLLSSGYGSSNFEQGIQNTRETKFRIGSITKSFTAAAILQMVDQGRIGLEDTIDRYVPRQTGGNRITIHQLLSHTSGIPNYTDNPLMNTVKPTFSAKPRSSTRPMPMQQGPSSRLQRTCCYGIKDWKPIKS